MFSILLEINWQELLLGQEKWEFLVETAFRSLVMFLVILFTLRLLGKRGIKQLSVFELGVIIGLGSAAGDPMFYKDVGLLPGLVVFTIVLGLYKFVTYLINRSEKFEHFVEGEPVYVIKEGRILIDNFENEDIAREELMMQLRLNHVSHLGQVETAILETNGEVSLYFYPDDEVKPGLPILPQEPGYIGTESEEDEVYACTKCGNINDSRPAKDAACNHCKETKWLKAIDKKRIS